MRRPHRRWGWLPTLALAILATTPAFCAGGVTLKLEDAPLTTALMALTQQAEIVFGDTSAFKGKTVTVDLKDRPIDYALDAILSSYKIPWYKDDQGVYHINATKPEPAAPAVAPSSEPIAPLPAAKPRYRVTEKIELQSISPREALVALRVSDGTTDRWEAGTTPTSPLAPDDWFPGGSLRPASPMGSPASNVGPVQVGTVDGNLVTTSNINVAPTLGPAGPTDPQDGLNRTPGERDLLGQAPGTTISPRRPGFQPRPAVPGATTPGTATTPGATGPGTTATGQRGFLPEGIDLVAGLASDNSLLVQGDPDAIDELRSILRYLDIAPAQVSVKVDLIEVSTSALRSFGGTYSFFTKLANITAQPGTAPGPNLTADIVTGNLQAVIGAVTSDNKGRTIASPMVTTLNNTPVSISKAILTATFIPQTITSPAGIVTVSQPVPIQIQTSLTVIPRVNRDGTITLTVAPQVANPGETITSPDGSVVYPTQNQTYTQVTRRVRSGETIVIAGLNSVTQQNSISKVPLLADIPIIGKLFRRVDRSTQDSELLIFVTPTVISEVAQGEAEQ